MFSYWESWLLLVPPLNNISIIDTYFFTTGSAVTNAQQPHNRPMGHSFGPFMWGTGCPSPVKFDGGRSFLGVGGGEVWPRSWDFHWWNWTVANCIVFGVCRKKSLAQTEGRCNFGLMWCSFPSQRQQVTTEYLVEAEYFGCCLMLGRAEPTFKRRVP